MIVHLKLFLFLYLGSFVGGISLYRSPAGNNNCSWLTVEASNFEQTDPPFQFVFSSYEDRSDVSQQECEIISLKIWTPDKLSHRSWLQSETRHSDETNGRLHKVRRVFRGTKILPYGLWFRGLPTKKPSQVLRVDVVCKGQDMTLTRKCLLLDVRGKIHPQTDRIQVGRSLLSYSEENTMKASDMRLLLIVLVCGAIGMCGLSITLFLCVKDSCSRNINNDPYMVAECVVGTGTYKGDEEEPAPAEPLISEEKKSSQRCENGSDEGMQQQVEKDKLNQSTGENQNEDSHNTSSTPNGNLNDVTSSSTDALSGIYEEVIKDESPLKKEEVSNQSQTGNQTEGSDGEHAKPGSGKSKRKSKKGLKVNVKAAEAHRSEDGQATPSSAGAKKAKKWFHKDGGKHTDDKSCESKAHGDMHHVEAELKTDRQRMSTPDKNRRSVEPRPLPPSPISPSYTPNNEQVGNWPDPLPASPLQEDYYESVEQNDVEMEDSTYETFEHNEPETDVYTTIDENNRRVSVCESDTYDSVTATVRSSSSGCIYESVDKEISSSEANSSPPVPSVSRLMSISIKRKTSTENDNQMEDQDVSHSPTEYSPALDTKPLEELPPTAEEKVTDHFYTQPDMEKKRLSRKAKQESEAKKSSGDFESFSDECAYEPVTPTNKKSVEGDVKVGDQGKENPYDSVNAQDYAEVQKNKSSPEKDVESSETAVPVAEDPYAVPPEVPYRSPDLDKKYFPDYEQYIPENVSTTNKECSPQTSKADDLAVNPYEPCENMGSEKRDSAVLIEGSCTASKDSENLYEELNVSDEAKETNKL